MYFVFKGFIAVLRFVYPLSKCLQCGKKKMELKGNQFQEIVELGKE